ncbi:unnamed protein product [Linum tenue]|uniref:Uncharacterized protein n=1 Tax=Linum tenue TaxID=586396 RepID=A0AAV0MIC0_9ROSI|nr:unnamed protein product [Linum tenue]
MYPPSKNPASRLCSPETSSSAPLIPRLWMKTTISLCIGCRVSVAGKSGI